MDDFIWAVGLFSLAGLGGAASQLLVELVRTYYQAAVFTRRVRDLLTDPNSDWIKTRGWRRPWRVLRMWNDFAWEQPTSVRRGDTGEAVYWPGCEPTFNEHGEEIDG